MTLGYFRDCFIIFFCSVYAGKEEEEKGTERIRIGFSALFFPI